MKRYLLLILASVLFLSFQTADTKAASSNNINIKIDNKNQSLRAVSIVLNGIESNKDVTSFIYNKRTLVPIRYIAEFYGAQVSWEQQTMTATIGVQNNVIKLKINSQEYNINGENKPLDKGSIAKLAKYKDEYRTYVPLRLVSEILGYSVSWDDKSYKAVIESSYGGDAVSILPTESETEKTQEKPTISPQQGANVNNIELINNTSGSDKVKIMLDNTQSFNAQTSGEDLILVLPNAKLDLKNQKKSGSLDISSNTFKGVDYVENQNDTTIVIRGASKNADVYYSKDKKSIYVSNSHTVSGIEKTVYNGKDAFLIKGLSGAEIKKISFSNPNRLVLDIFDSRFTEGSMYKEYKLSMGAISGVRISQFDTDKNYKDFDRVVRVVFDISSSNQMQDVDITDDGENTYISLKKSLSDVVDFETVSGKRVVNIKGFQSASARAEYNQETKTVNVYIDNPMQQIETGEISYNDALIKSIKVGSYPNGYYINIVCTRAVNYESIGDGSNGTFSINLSKSDSKNPKDILIMIDPGHGGKDPGAVSKIDGSSEVDYIAYVQRALEQRLLSDGYNVVKTNNTDDKYIDIYERAKMANSLNADIFVSIHVNCADNNSMASGVEVLYASEKKYKNKTLNQLELATCILDAVEKEIGNRGRGLKEGAYVVLKNSNMPAALLEMEFLSSPKGLNLLHKKEYLDKMVNALYNGIVRYLTEFY